MDIPIFNITINENNDDETGVNLVSFVNDPAIESNFVTLSNPTKAFVSLNAEKQILTGPALIPDKQILRLDENGDPYFIVFTKETIEQIRDKFHRLKKTDQTNDEHETELDNNFLVESWLISDSNKDKTAALGLEELPPGTWVTSYKIPNKEYWDEFIKTGKRLGFSIEGFFSLEIINEELKKIKNSNMTRFEKFYKIVKEFILSETDEKGTDETQLEETTEDTTEKMGDNFAAWLNDKLNNMVTETEDMAAVIARMVEATGMEADAMAAILNGSTVCPTADTLAAIGEFINAPVSELMEVLAADGCTYETTDEPEPETDGTEAEKIEQSKEDKKQDWANLEALAKIDELTAQLEKVTAEKDAEIAELKKTVEELNKQPGAEKIETTETIDVSFSNLSMIEKLKKANEQIR